MTTLAAAYQTCIDITRRRALNFYYAFLTLPRPARRSICALYAYCRLLDDLADDEGTPREKEAAIQAVHRRFHQSLAGESDDPIMIALKDTIHRYQIDVRHIDEITQGVLQDLTVSRYATFEELKAYCYLVSSAVGLASLPIFGYTSPKAHAAAIDMGVAMQLTNVLRDISEDAASGRIYLPTEDLIRFGVDERELARATPTRNVRALIAFQVDRAEEYFQRARALFAYLPRRSRPCPMVLLGVYHRILREIRNREYDPMSQRITLPRGRRAWLAIHLSMKGLLWRAPTSSS